MQTSKPVAYVGVDPGLKGGIVSLTGDGLLSCRCQHLELEYVAREEVVRWVRLLCDAHRVVCVLEKIPTAIFGIKKSDMSKLYGSYAELRAMFICCGIFPQEIPADVWLREFIGPRKKGESTTHWKNRHRDCARKLYDDGTISTNMCDAYLIALYCDRLHNGKLRGDGGGKKSDAGESVD